MGKAAGNVNVGLLHKVSLSSIVLILKWYLTSLYQSRLLVFPFFYNLQFLASLKKTTVMCFKRARWLWQSSDFTYLYERRCKKVKKNHSSFKLNLELSEWNSHYYPRKANFKKCFE